VTSPTHTDDRLPDLHRLETGLTVALAAAGQPHGQVSVLARETPVHTTTFPNEVLTCTLPDGRIAQLFSKYEAGHDHNAFGHRSGVTYEADVYRQVLDRLPLSRLTWYGSFLDRTTDNTWLFVEYAANSVPLHEATDPAAMSLAAGWIGSFHAANESRLWDASLAFLNRYDAAYYRGWSRRTVAYAHPLLDQFPWLTALCERFESYATQLESWPQAVLHGEYYPQNLLYRDAQVYPVDWESAAIGLGEIDLASLTERWPAETVAQCERAYRDARWPDGTPETFEKALAAARLYWQFRWLGDRPEWTAGETWRFHELLGPAERLGLL